MRSPVAVRALGLLLVVAVAACGSSPAANGPATAPASTPTPSIVPTVSAGVATSDPAMAGKRLVFQNAGRVRTAMLDGSGVVDVAPSAPADQEHPDWSHDGKSLVFDTELSMLWVVNSDGTALRSVYTCEAPCHSLQDGAWSPDGSEIAFMVAETEDGATTSLSAILSLNVGSGAVRTIVDDTSGRVWLFHPRWSGDGQSIVFERDTFASNRVDESTTTKVAVAVASASGGTDAKNVASWDGPISGLGSPDPDWNSVDDLIVFCRNDNLFTVQPDGTSEAQLTRFDAQTQHAIQPTFTPDGTGILFTLVKGHFGVDDALGAALVDLKDAHLVPVGGDNQMTHTRLQP